jgi:glutamine synthetase type III
MSTTSQGNQGRLWAIAEISRRTPRVVPALANEKVSDVFGANTFNQKVMSDKLPRNIYKELLTTIKQGSKLNHAIANEVAHAVKEWALEKGATHFCHWFQPHTGLTA